MSRKFAVDIDLLSAFAIRNALLNPVSSDPGSLGVQHAGLVWVNTSASPPTLKYWTGTAVKDVMNLGDMTGTLLASKISDLASTVQGYSLSQFAAPTGDLSLASHKLTNVVDPAGNQDAATKNYVDSQLAGLSSGQVLKGAVKVAVTGNVSLTSPGATLDGISLTAGDLVLLTGQSTGAQNGPYQFNGPTSALTRADNWNSAAEAVIGSYWIVQQGSKADNFALLTNDTAITLDTTALTFTFVGSVSFTQGNGISISGGVISAVQNTGVTVSSSGIGADFSIVGRKFVGAIPTVTAGAFTVSGSTVVINHGLSNSAPLFVLRAGSVPASGYTTGQLVEIDAPATDANNITATLPAAPSTNNWNVTVIG